jgi:hypothetical protein
MGKRFTETGKWTDKWFRRLTPEFKMAWCYVTDCCDQAGVIDLDRDLANFQIGAPVEWDAFLTECGDRIRLIAKGKWFIAGFIKFQYGKLSADCKPHMPVIQLLERHGINIDDVEQNAAYKYGTVDSGKRAKVFARDGQRCCYCGEYFGSEGLEPDHVIPASRGGNDSMGNLVAACIPCNRAKSDRHPTDFINSLPDPSAAWQRLSQRVNERLYQSLKDKEQEKEKDQDTETEKVKEKGAGGTKRFTPPTVGEVADHCRSRNNTIDAEAFVAHYTANGWVQGNGKKPVRDWKACIITWEKNAQSNRGSPMFPDDPRGNFNAAHQYLESLKK